MAKMGSLVAAVRTALIDTVNADFNGARVTPHIISQLPNCTGLKRVEVLIGLVKAESIGSNKKDLERRLKGKAGKALEVVFYQVS